MTTKKMSSAKFSEYVMGVDDLYNMAIRNRSYLPKKSSSAVNETMLFNILQGIYWCPKYEDIKMLPCVKAPIKEVLNDKVQALCQARGYNIGWIDFK